MRHKVYSGLTRNGKDIHGNEFTYATGSRGRVRVKEFGRSAIPDNQSRKQRADHWHLSRFDVGIIQIYEREYKFQPKRCDEFIDDV
jgi:hypothetical protein